MKTIIKLSLLFGFLLINLNAFSIGDPCDAEAPLFTIRPAAHPNACVALELENITAATVVWQFSPPVVVASTGLTVSSLSVAAGETPIVYWTGVGDKSIKYGSEGWEDFHSCSCNPIAADDFEYAPLICNSNTYCGTTSSAYGVDQQDVLSCAGTDHTGDLDNNSWLRFIATGTSATFDIFVAGTCEMQFAVYEYNPGAATTADIWIRKTNSVWTSTTGFQGANTITATGLTAGKEYYLHFDGDGGQECDYDIDFASGFVSSSISASDQLVCEGEAVTITATPNDPNATYTWTINGGAPISGGSTLNANPTVTTTYAVSIGLPGCSPAPQQIIVDMDNCSVLPVELNNFNINCNDSYTELSWETVSEHNNDYFQLEKANSDLEFRTIAMIDGAGNSVTTQYYSVKDVEKTSGDIYYRIRQVDFDGSESFSDIISSAGCQSSGFKVNSIKYLQLSKEFVIDYVAVRSTNVELKLVDIMGRPYLLDNLILEPNSNQIRIKADDLAGNSMYILNISSDNTSDTERIYVNH